MPELFEPRCEECPWDKEFPEALYRLNEIMLLQDAGKQIAADDLTDREWLALGRLKIERDILTAEEARENRDGQNQHQ